MIIVCNNCNKKFDIDSALIPEKGRLLQCNGCDHKWFFKKELTEEPITPVKIKEPTEVVKPFKDESEHLKVKNPENIELLDAQINKDFTKEETSIDKNKDINLDIDLKNDPSLDKKNYNILGLTIVFIISFIALIIVLDTFQKPISKYIPNIEFLLYSLYETINDIKLFLKDLI
jgi:predicted Zn finger-like uncharacterized protein